MEIIGAVLFIMFVVGFFRIESTVLKTHEAIERIEKQLGTKPEKEKK